MTEYARLLSKLRKQKSKIKDLPELISKITFTKDRILLLKHIIGFLEENQDTEDFRWLDNSNQRKSAEAKNRKILAQFAYKVQNPHRVLTIYRKIWPTK